MTNPWILSGYVPVDKNWTGFSAEEYQAACESVGAEEQKPVVENDSGGHGLSGVLPISLQPGGYVLLE